MQKIILLRTWSQINNFKLFMKDTKNQINCNTDLEDQLTFSGIKDPFIFYLPPINYKSFDFSSGELRLEMKKMSSGEQLIQALFISYQGPMSLDMIQEQERLGDRLKGVESGFQIFVDGI